MCPIPEALESVRAPHAVCIGEVPVKLGIYSVDIYYREILGIQSEIR